MKDKQYYLAAEASEASPALVMGTFPAKVNGLNAHYYWRQAARDGKYVHPTAGFEVDVNPERRQHWEDNFNDMRRLGISVPIVADHKEKAENTSGYVVAVRNRDEWYEELHQYLGDDARDTALRNKISIGIAEEYKDGKGRIWHDAIRHSAITPLPVIPDTGAVVPLSRGGDSTAIPVLYLSAAPTPSTELSMKCSPEYTKAVKEVTGGGDEIHDENAHDHLLGWAKGVKGKYNLSLTKDEVDQKVQALSAATTELTDLKKTHEMTVAELSAAKPKVIDEEALEALAEADDSGIESLVGSGAITPTVSKKLSAALVGESGKRKTFALSLASTGIKDRVSRAVIDALKENKPVKLGGITGAQELSRAVPGDDGKNTDKPKQETPAEMAKRLKGK